MKNRSVVIFLLLLLPLLSFADCVIVKDGTKYKGAILKSDDKQVYLQVSDTIFSRIPHSLVRTITFRYADMVYLLNGETIKCKVLTRSVTELNIVAENGPRTIKIMDLKRYFYNENDSLIITSLPQTGDVFNNEKSLSSMDTRMDKTIFFSLAGGAIYPDGKTWQKDFITANSLLGIFSQGQIGFTLVRNIAIYGGYMVNQYSNTAENDLQSEVNFGYYHLGVDYFHTFDFLPGVNFSIGGDAGMVNLNGKIYTYSYRELDLSGLSPNIGFRLLIGARLFFLKQVSASIKAGYFSIQDFIINVPAEIEYDVTLPLSGWTIMFGASFHLPI